MRLYMVKRYIYNLHITHNAPTDYVGSGTPLVFAVYEDPIL